MSVTLDYRRKCAETSRYKRRRWCGLLLALAMPVSGIGDVQTTTQTVCANISPYGKLSLPASVNLRSGDTRFGSNFAGAHTVSYWARTSDSGGGSVTLQA